MTYNEQLASIVELETSKIEYDLIDTSYLTSIIKDLENLEKIQEIKFIDTSDLKFDSNNQFAHFPIEYLESIIEQMESEQNNLNDLQSKKDNVDNWKVKIELEIENFISENHFCPTCSQKIDKKHILGENHA